MSDPSHSRQASSSSSSTRSYSRPLSTSSSPSSFATQPATQPPQPKGYSRPRAGGIDFGQPPPPVLEEEPPATGGRVMGGLWGPPLAGAGAGGASSSSMSKTSSSRSGAGSSSTTSTSTSSSATARTSSSSSSSNSRIPQRERQSSLVSSSSGHHLPSSSSMSTSSSSSSTHSHRQSQPPPPPPPSSTLNRLSHPPQPRSSPTTPTSSRTNRPPRRSSPPPSPSASATLLNQNHRTSTSFPPNRTVSLTAPSSPTTILSSSSSHRHSQALSFRSNGSSSTGSPRTSSYSYGSLSLSSSPYTVYQPQVSIRSASATGQGQGADDTVRQRRERRPSFGSTSFGAADAGGPSSWRKAGAGGGEDSSSLKSLESSVRRLHLGGEGGRGEMLDTSSDEDQQDDDLLGQQELRRPSWVSVRIPSLSLPSGRSDSTVTITPSTVLGSSCNSSSSNGAGTPRRRSDIGGSPLMDELPLPSSHVSVTSTSSPSPSFTSFASSHPDASPSFPSTSLFNSASSSPPPPTTSTRTGVRPPPIILPPSPRQQKEAAAAFQAHSRSQSQSQPQSQPYSPVSSSTASNPSNLLTSPLISPPALPARSPLRPRYGSPSPSHASGGSSRHRRHASNRTSSSFSQSSADFQDAEGGERELELDATTRGGGSRPELGRRTTSSSSNGEASWSTGKGGGGRESYRSGGGGTEVWLDEDQEEEREEGKGMKHSRSENGWAEEVRSHSRGSGSATGGGSDTGGGGARTRPASAGSRVVSKTKLKRREARVTSVYMGESSDSNADSPRRSRTSTYPPSPSLPPPPPLARAAPPTPPAVTLPFSGPTAAPSVTFPPSPSLGPRSPSCPAFSTLQEIPNESTLPSDSTVTQNLTLLASPTIVIPPTPPFPVPSIVSPSSAHARSISQPLASPSLNKPLPSPSPSLPTPTTKRAHLLHEIHSTERSYALDLALVRDAYIQRLRPPHPSGATTVGEPTPTSSSRNSIYTSTEMGSSLVLDDTSRSMVGGGGGVAEQQRRVVSAGDRASKVSVAVAASSSTSSVAPTPPPFFSPAEGVRSPPVSLSLSDAASTSSYFPSYGSTTSSVTLPRFVFSPGSTVGAGGVGPLSTADVRAVFLNVEALAALAEEFASVLERMAGKEEGEDMIGEAFLTMMPRIKQAYTSYCPRQSTANVRLVELLANPLYTSYFADSWSIAQPHTKAWDLPSLLIKPVQRVLKYPLLLDDLLKCTPPPHPDFENLQKAAKLIKSVADEINEVKRRKDTVDRIIHGKHADVSSTSLGGGGGSSSKDSKSNKRGVKMGFNRKSDKDRVSSSGSSSIHHSNSTAAAAMQFTHESHEKLRETEEEYARLVARLMSAEATAKKMGKIVAGSGTRAREVWVKQREMVEGWRRLINLGGMEPVEDIRIEAYRVVVHEILEGPCRVMDEELRDSLVPNLITLFNICKGPRTVILKRNSKHEDYNRVVISKNKGEWDRLSGDLVEGAQIFVALHHQLLAELPALLDGFSAILDLVVTALAACHARFHRSVHAKLARFWEEFPPVVMDGELASSEASSDGAAIIRVWEEAARTPTDMMESLSITRRLNVRVMEPPTLIASGSSTPNPHGIISRASSTMSIRRSDTASSGPRTSVASNSTSSTSSLPFESTSRSRSSSNARPPVPSPASPLPLPGGETKTGMFHFRTKSKGSKLERHGSQNALVAPSPALPPASLPLTARSQTLPPVPTTTTTHIPIPLRTAPKRNSDHYASSSASSHGPALSALSFEGSDTNPDAFSESVARRLSHPDDHDHHEGADRTFTSSNRGSGFSFERRSIHNGNGNDDEQPESPLTPVHPYAASAVTPTKANGNGRGIIKLEQPPLPPQVEINRSPDDDDEEDPDSPTPTLYRCECVADFDLRGLSISYMGHDFLSIRRGEEIDVVFEIGRVDELDEFPLDVGLEDDGLLIGRDQNGLQGFVLCSFLHPLEVNE